MKNATYEKLLDNVIESMATAGADWVKPWSYKGALRNLFTKKSYRGINIFFLSFAMASFKYPFFCTFKQAKQNGYNVKKGSKGNQIVFFNMIEVEEDERIKKIPMLKTYTVFNVEQLEGYDLTTLDVEAKNNIELVENAEQYVKNTKAKINLVDGDRAFYTVAGDAITMPKVEQFDNVEEYYSTLLHELTHWTGNAKRNDRDLSGGFGSKSYAFEELVAELGSVFLCNALEIEKSPAINHAKYLNGWLQILREDKRALYRASSLAQKAVDYLDAMQIASEDRAVA